MREKQQKETDLLLRTEEEKMLLKNFISLSFPIQAEL